MPAVKAVRIRTSSGWQDIAIQGAAGAPGAPGQKGLNWRGTYDSTKSDYVKDDVVFYNGSSWRAPASMGAGTTPGTDPNSNASINLQFVGLTSIPPYSGPFGPIVGSTRQYRYVDINPGGSITISNVPAGAYCSIWKGSDGSFIGEASGSFTASSLVAGRYVVGCNYAGSIATMTLSAGATSTLLPAWEFVAQKGDQGATGSAGPQGPSGGILGSGVRAYSTATTSVNNVTWTEVAFGGETDDPAGQHDTSTNTNRLTIPATGWYLVTASLPIQSNSAGSRRIIELHKNGSTTGDATSIVARTELHPTVAQGTSPVMNLSGAYFFTAGDYVSLAFWQDSGGTLTCGGTAPPAVISAVAITGVKGDAGAVVAGCRLKLVATQNNTSNDVSWDSEDFDTHSFHDTVTNPQRITIPPGMGGTYLITASLGWAASASGVRNVGIYKNGSLALAAIAQNPIGSADSIRQTVATIAQLVPGDYVTVNGYNGGFTIALEVNNGFAHFAAFMLAAQSGAVVPRVTSLPGSPVDGQEVYYVADATNGVLWHLRYNASGGTYKWEFVGGSPLYAEVATGESTGSTTYADLATVGPSITVPLAGDYMLEFGSIQAGSSVGVSLHGMALGGTAAADSLSVRGGGNVQSSGQRAKKITLASASQALVAKFRVTSGTGNWSDRWTKVTPIRVT